MSPPPAPTAPCTSGPRPFSRKTPAARDAQEGLHDGDYRRHRAGGAAAGAQLTQGGRMMMHNWTGLTSPTTVPQGGKFQDQRGGRFVSVIIFFCSSSSRLPQSLSLDPGSSPGPCSFPRPRTACMRCHRVGLARRQRLGRDYLGIVRISMDLGATYTLDAGYWPCAWLCLCCTCAYVRGRAH